MNIRLEQFSLLRGENQIFENINFTFEYGKYHLIGLNGSGKTSLLNCIYKLDNNYEGEIYLDDINIKDIDNKKLREYYISYINQNFIYFEWLSIIDNISIIIKDKDVQNQIIKEMKNEFDSSEKTKINQLSGGQKQYFNILLSIFSDSKILIIDEPFNNLSKLRIKKIEEKIKKIDKLILIVSHKDTSYQRVEIYEKRLKLCEN